MKHQQIKKIPMWGGVRNHLLQQDKFTSMNVDMDSISYATLLEIAYLDPSIVGPAPLIAADFLGILLNAHLNNQKVAGLGNSDKSAIAKYVPQNVVNVYPNPIQNGVLQIESSEDGLKTISIFNMYGVLITNHENSNISKHLALNLPNLTAGMYLVRIVDVEGRVYVKKLVVK